MKNYYEVMDNTNTITNGEYSVRWTGSKLFPRFVAQDIAKGIGYKFPGAMYGKFDPDYVDAGKGKKGRTLMRSLSTYQVEEVLSINDRRLRESRDAFREFWEDTVLPVFDEKYAVIAAQKREIARKEAEIARQEVELAALREELAMKNEKIVAIKSLIA